MSKDDSLLEDVAHYFTYLLDTFYLKSYHISVGWEPKESGHVASVIRLWKYDSARLQVSRKQFGSMDDEMRVKVLLHELGHLLMRDCDFVVDRLVIKPYLSKTERKVAREAYSQAYEKFCDRFAESVAPLLDPWEEVLLERRGERE